MKNHILLYIAINCLFGATHSPEAQYLKEIDKKDIKGLNRILPPITAIELKLIRSFPNEGEEAQGYFLPQPDSFARDSRGYFYIPDTKANVIFKFDQVGTYIGKCGHPGQGPGDLSLPMNINIYADIIQVFDVGNRRVQWLDLSGRYIDSKRIFKDYNGLVFLPDGGFLGAPANLERGTGNSLVDVLDEKGKIVRSFGNPVDFNYDRSAMNSRKIMISSNKEIFLVFECLPIIQKYSVDGQLIMDKLIQNEFSTKKEKINRRMNSYLPNNRPAKIVIFFAATLFDDLLFLADYVPNRLWIWAFDSDLKLLRTYYWNNAGDFMNIRYMTAVSDRNQLYFYILGSLYQGGEEKVHLFSSK